jgi:hypothetical protein
VKQTLYVNNVFANNYEIPLHSTRNYSKHITLRVNNTGSGKMIILIYIKIDDLTNHHLIHVDVNTYICELHCKENTS